MCLFDNQTSQQSVSGTVVTSDSASTDASASMTTATQEIFDGNVSETSDSFISAIMVSRVCFSVYVSLCVSLSLTHHSVRQLGLCCVVCVCVVRSVHSGSSALVVVWSVSVTLQTSQTQTTRQHRPSCPGGHTDVTLSPPAEDYIALCWLASHKNFFQKVAFKVYRRPFKHSPI